ncbi:MAG TPA: carboxypeptidase-like regulatory domain-containing protein [Candidatus Binataceae bacterium]|nr:carboxypeptidase-like regulatory domain-containing protein [Candidatus Binataceae bacterium]
MPGLKMALVTTLSAIALIATTSPRLNAFCFQPQPIRVCAEFFKADEVFTGTVIANNYQPNGIPEPTEPQPGWHYRLKVQDAYRGTLGPVVDIYTEDTSGRFPLDSGQSYLLFAYKTGSIAQIFGCANSTKLADAGPKVAEINRIVKAAGSDLDGEIWGRIVQWLGGAGVAGVQVTARGNESVYRTRTIDDGSFHLRVPPGQYSIIAQSPHWNFSKWDVSFDDPSHLRIEPGGCAQVQLGALAK